jgi:hypothetical protein
MSHDEYEVIGDPSELLVQEAVFAAMHDTDQSTVATDDVVARLMALVDLSAHDARRRVTTAIRNADVGVTVTADDAALWIDPVTAARIERRYNYWTLHKQGSATFHAHVANEEWHARCALRQWSHAHDNELPTWDDLVGELCEMLGAECSRSGGNHIALNALDAGAIYMTSHPTRTAEVRFATTEDTDPEGLES